MSNIYSPPSADVSNVGIDDATYEPKVFALSGRIGRLRMLAFGLGATLALSLLMAVVAGLGGLVLGPVVAMILAGLIYIPMIVLSFAYAVRRLNDLNLSGWWCLLSFVPFVNIIYGLYVLFAPGTKGSNNYGPAPSDNPRWVIVTACIMPVLFILAIVAAVSTGFYDTYSNMGVSGSSSSF